MIRITTKRSIRLFGIVAGAGLLAVSGLALKMAFPQNTATLSVKNASGESIINLKVSVARKSFQSDEVAPGQSVSVLIHDFGDDHWQVSGRLGSTKPFDQGFGYITNGMSFADTLTIYSLDRMTFETTSALAR